MKGLMQQAADKRNQPHRHLCGALDIFSSIHLSLESVEMLKDTHISTLIWVKHLHQFAPHLPQHVCCS